MECPDAGRRGAPLFALGLIALLLYAAATFGSLGRAVPHLTDRDGYFHARYANLLPERGLSRRFEYATESFLRDRFSDQHFLFHVLLAPLASREESMVPGAKIAVVALDVAIVASFALVLRALRLRLWFLFAFLLLSAGNHFLFRLQMARPHLVAILFVILASHAILERRRLALFALSFVLAWSYSAPHLLFCLALLDAAARLIRDREVRLGPSVAALGGAAAGLVFHPYFPNDLYEFYVQIVLVLGQAWGLVADTGLALGREFAPVTTRSLLESSGGATLAFLGGAAAAVLARERPSARTASLFFMASGALGLFLLSSRFVEYFAPLAILFGASAATDLLGEMPLRVVLLGRGRGPLPEPANAPPERAGAPRGIARRSRLLAALRIAGVAALLAIVVMLHIRGVREARRTICAVPPPSLEGSARYVRAHVPPGEIVGHLNWGDFPVLFHFDPTHRYLVGYDPTFMWVRDRARALYLEDLRLGRRPLDPSAFARTFGTRTLVVNKERRAQFEAALDAGLEPVYEDAGGAVFALPEAGSP